MALVQENKLKKLKTMTKTQQISRANLQVIFNTICEGWKNKLSLILEEQTFNEKIELEESLILQGYSEADSKQKKLLEKYFTISVPKNIMERVKNFDDVLKIAGKTEEDILPWKNPKTKQQISQNAFAKIQLISEVLNEGWIPNFNNSSEYKYYPWFEKKSPPCGSWCLGYVSFYSSGGGLGFGCSYKTEQLAKFAANTFIKEYIDYLPA